MSGGVRRSPAASTVRARGRVVMILGAGPLQRPLVAAARARGLHVVAVDNVPGNVAHALASESRFVSTRDVPAVVLAARALRPDAILTACSDVATPAVAAVVDELGIPGVPAEVAARLSAKDAFRRFQRAAGLPHPAFVSGADANEVVDRARALSGPVVVKPVDRSGSRGVSRLEVRAEHALRAAIERARQAGFDGRVCVEEVIPGREYGGDAVAAAGALRAFVTEKHVVGTVVRGHHVPPGLDADGLAAIEDAIRTHAALLGVRDGILNFDVMLGPDGAPVVIEMSPRLGGNWIPQLVAHAWGVDLLGCALDLALGRAPALVAPGPARPAGSYVLGARGPGRLGRLPRFDALRAELPDLVALEWDVRAGDRVEPLRDSGEQVGRALFDLAGREYEEMAARLDAALDRCVEPGAPVCRVPGGIPA